MSLVTKFQLIPAGFVALFANPNNEIARFVEGQGDRVVDATKQNLGTPYRRPFLNPPPGPPQKRSGDLQGSVMRRSATVGAEGLEVLVTSSAEHRGADYSRILRDREYEFINLEALQGGQQ